MAKKVTKTAVILAAGLGSRLKEHTKEKPKGFLEIDQLSLIERSVKKLLASGITRILIGTGYLSEFFEELAIKYPQIECIKNNIFAETGSMYTLYNMRDSINESFLLLESDLLYDKLALDTLLSSEKPDVILASGKTGSQDEVYIEADTDWNLVNMSKKTEELHHISGELVGINKISPDAFKMMCAFSEETYKNNYDIHYEDAFVGMASKSSVFIHKIEDLAWCEIDDAHHLQRALDKVYPKILEREG